MSKIELVRLALKQKPDCNIQILCNTLSIARSLVYYRSKKEQKDLLFKSVIETIHAEHPWYGHRRIAWSMKMGFKKARRLMRVFSIRARTKLSKRFVKPKDRNIPDTTIKNLAKRQCPIRSNAVWRSDFTHIIYHGRHLYLATVIDAFTKEILGYALSFVHTQEFILEAIAMALAYTASIPEIFHSDQGSEYRSFLVLDYLMQHGIVPSMSKKGSPWENGGQESYYGKFKLELGHPHAYESIELLIEAIHHRIYYYNHKRIHTALKMPPVAFRKLLEEGQRQLLQPLLQPLT